MKNVLIATPSYDGKVDAHFTAALVESTKIGFMNDINFIPIFMAYDALVQRARNDLIATAINSNCDDMIWIDADIEWEPEWLLKLLNYSEDVVGGTYPKKSLTEEQYVCKINLENKFTKNDNGLILVESLGTGFLKLSKKAFTYLWNNSKPYIHNNKECRWIFEVKIQDGDIISEDVLMCQRLKEGDFKVYLDPSMTCNHIGAYKWQGNFGRWAEKINI